MAVMPAAVGDIIHRSLDAILRMLHSESCASLQDPAAVQALRGVGGFSSLIGQEIDRQIQLFSENPRTTARAGRLRLELAQMTPVIRQRLQSLVARADLRPGAETGGAVSAAPGAGFRLPLRDGSNPEVPLRAQGLRFAGRADLITLNGDHCAITDYKTGAPDEHHAEQLQIYNLLWSVDTDVNPNRIAVTSLTVAYATHDVSVSPLGVAGLDALAEQLNSRVHVAGADVSARPPPARPDAQMCRMCGVRHLCEDYWITVAGSDSDGRFIDSELLIKARNGPRSWLAEIQHSREQALLRTPTEDSGFQVGDRIRLLGAVKEHEAENEATILTVTQVTELFLLTDS